MPWKRAKALPPPELGIALFEAQFRIQREACEAAGRYIPLVVENVCGAQRWVGRARWHFGSYYLWGDVPALMPFAISFQSAAVAGMKAAVSHAWFNDHKKAGVEISDSLRLSRSGSASSIRKETSALIAKIPFDLAQHIARCFKPAAAGVSIGANCSNVWVDGQQRA
jgi:hypothetical protein